MLKKYKTIPKAGVDERAPKPVAPKPGIEEAPKAGVEVGAPKAGVEEGVPKAGVEEGVPKAGVEEGVPKAGVDEGVPKAGEEDAAPNMVASVGYSSPPAPATPLASD